MVSPSNFVHEIVPPFYFLHDAGAFVEAGSYNVFKGSPAAFLSKVCAYLCQCFVSETVKIILIIYSSFQHQVTLYEIDYKCAILKAVIYDFAGQTHRKGYNLSE